MLFVVRFDAPPNFVLLGLLVSQNTTTCEVLFRPQTNGQRFLPEGPISLGPDLFSWVAIQLGKNSLIGSLNVYDCKSGTNESHELPGRPGFALPTTSENEFICGANRSLGLYNTATRDWRSLAEDIDGDVDGTIINDGVAYEHCVVFGCKDLNFEEAKAGLYLWRGDDQTLIKLRSDQTCSNGKAIIERDGDLILYDIDTPKKTLVSYEIDVLAGTLSEPTTVLDLNSLDMFPDGMILTPDEQSCIIAFYNPNDADNGEARQYNLSSGELEHTWLCPKAPQVTCPALIEIGGETKLVLTTAVEHMSPTRQQAHSNSGSLFFGATDFANVG